MPDFLIIGAQRCGTTSLYRYLTQHPQILPASDKEVHFFDFNFDKGLDWYEAQFPSKTPGTVQRTGEASPYYLVHPRVPQRVRQHYPEVKLIVLLRDPVERAISHYHHEVRLGVEPLSLPDAIAAESERLEGEYHKLSADETYYSFAHQHYTYLTRGRYLEQLQEWMALFPPEQFLILKSEDLFADPARMLSRVLEFLNLPVVDFQTYPSHNAGNYCQADESVRQDLVEYFRPYNRQLAAYLDCDLAWNDSPMNQGMAGIDYEGAWDTYARTWKQQNPDLDYIGDEWIGQRAGAANSLAEYTGLIEQHLIQPHIDREDTVLEIGVGGGKTAALLRQYCHHLICADISSQMLRATQNRLGSDRVTYVKLDGLSLNGIEPNSVDVCFCYDTMVHIEPYDIFNYLTQVPKLLRGRRLCVFHHTNVLSDLGWKKFLRDWQINLMGHRHGAAFSVMTDSIMEKFLTHLNYEIIEKNTTLVPRDCIWICKAPTA